MLMFISGFFRHAATAVQMPALAFVLLLSLLTTAGRAAGLEVGENPAVGFPLAAAGKLAEIWIDDADFKVVKIAAGLLADDVERVTGLKPVVRGMAGDAPAAAAIPVIIGTLGKNRLLDRMVREHKLDTAGVAGQWESFLVSVVDRPLPGVERALVIAGGDRRGTAYGVFTLSEAIGVSPWYWWADVTPARRAQLFVSGGVRQGPPSVKYRGIFINDEGFGGLNPWAKKTFDPELGNIGPKTYAKIFELLLRLKANYCWPAMHKCTQAFNLIPGNAQTADDYAIVMGSSHCEQMLRNNVSEWDEKRDGPWNYLTNRERILRYWGERVRTNAGFESTYTLGIRGVHDSAMEGARTLEEKVKYTQMALDDQRALLAAGGRDVTRIPQLLCSYKEVLKIYRGGLKVPDDVTLLWADDNHGYIRQLSNPDEQKRAGRAGVYYHLSYFGTPEAWLWLSTISPSLMAFEMQKAYACGADRIWVFNVGDIKPQEKELAFAMEMAWDVNRWTPANADAFIADWSARTFGADTASDIAAMMREYYLLAAVGKPEHCRHVAYTRGELDDRIARCRRLSAQAEAVGKRIPERLKAAYYELVQYPVDGTRWMNEQNLLARRSLARAAAGDAGALDDAAAAKAAHVQLDIITKRYNEENAGGKWNHIMNWHPCISGAMPKTATPELLAQARTAPAPVAFDCGTGVREFRWNSQKAGRTRLWLLATAPSGGSCTAWVNGQPLKAKFHSDGYASAAAAWQDMGEADVRQGENSVRLPEARPNQEIRIACLGLQPPLPMDFAQQIPAEKFQAKRDTPTAAVTILPGFGLGQGVCVMPFTAPSLTAAQAADAPWVEYKVRVPAGTTMLGFRTLPTQRIHFGRGVRYAVAVNGGAPVIFDIQADEFSPEWQTNVLCGCARRSLAHTSAAGGEIAIRVIFLDPGVVLQDIVVGPETAH